MANEFFGVGTELFINFTKVTKLNFGGDGGSGC